MVVMSIESLVSISLKEHIHIIRWCIRVVRWELDFNLIFNNLSLLLFFLIYSLNLLNNCFSNLSNSLNLLLDWSYWLFLCLGGLFNHIHFDSIALFDEFILFDIIVLGQFSVEALGLMGFHRAASVHFLDETDHGSSTISIE